MSYNYIDNVAKADLAFEAEGKTLEELFSSCCDALMNIMLENMADINPYKKYNVSIKAEYPDILLFRFLNEIVFRKDADNVFVVVDEIYILNDEGKFFLNCILTGEPINSEKHNILVDVKAVTLYKLNVEKIESGWKAFVVVDI